MDELQFPTLKQALLEWPSRPLAPISTATPPLLGRLRQILEPGRTSGTFASLQDLMVLLRQLLLSRSSDSIGERLSVPQEAGWPNQDMWQDFGFDVTRTAGRYLLEVRPWQPNWLGPTEAHQGDVFMHEHQAVPVRKDTTLPTDPFLLEITGFEHYVSPGQREALLSALFMPPGTTLVVNLPTGSGKTLVAQAPFLVGGPNSGLSLFIVPTNALALDLERRTREMLKASDSNYVPLELAWVSDRGESTRQAIKERIRSGRQGILFASPEAVCGSLLPSLYQAAQKGLISYLIIDEAHLIAQWGDAFRPAFQQIAGVRRGLLEVCPNAGFRTLLLSATFSPPILETLRTLFGPRDRLQMVSAVHLRPEPRYLSCQVSGFAEKQARLLELIRKVPRPFILYTTTRHDATSWFRRLRDAGFRRIANITGATPNKDREKIIDDWVEDRIDGVVATSAFGVGMDKSDVRTIIHATVPETLDRLYQEVGRGGRDGRASLSIILYDKDDMGIARSLNAPTLIGDKNGFERWTTLYQQAMQDPHNPGVRLVDLRKLPSGLQQQTDYNRDWNMRTLILMARARLIQMESVQPIQIERITGEDDAAFEARKKIELDAYFSTVPVRSLDPRLMDRPHFERLVGVERERSQALANHTFNQMLKALSGKREMADVLVELFSGDDVLATPACRGCPATGGAPHEEKNLYQVPAGIGISQLVSWDNQAWSHRFPAIDPSLVVVLCPSDQFDESLLAALQACVAAFGVRELALTASIRASKPALSKLHRWVDDQVLVLRDLQESLSAPDFLPLPRATVLKPWGNQPFPDELLLLERPLHLVFAPVEIRDAQHPLRLYRDTSSNCINLDEFLRRVTQ